VYICIWLIYLICDKHIGLQFALELRDEMYINISTDQHRFWQ